MITIHCINTQQICEKIHQQGKWKRVLAEQITLRNLDLAVWGSSLTCRIVSLDKELYSTLSLFIHVYKWVLATPCCGGGGGLPFDGLASCPGGSSNTPQHVSWEGKQNKLQQFGPLVRMPLYYTCTRCTCISLVNSNTP